ncbi:MAG: hypothetical protein ACE5HE_08610 [Phycisphaerae bacterium]
MYRIVHGRNAVACTAIAVAWVFGTTVAAQENAAAHSAPSRAVDYPLGRLASWDDGLCEMSYYRATDRIYGSRREYTRVQLVNRQWMGRWSGVKAQPDAEDAVAVFKLNLAEEIPTANYNYRYLTTVFLHRPDLKPFKMTVSSQEWCGATFKHLTWLGKAVSVRSFSYFEGEGSRDWLLDGQAVPYEALFLIVRDVAACAEPRDLTVLAAMRSTHQVEPVATKGTLVPRAPARITIAGNAYHARRVDLVWEGPLTGFLVGVDPPYYLLKYTTGPASGELLHVEKRAYWNPKSTSGFYQPGKAP